MDEIFQLYQGVYGIGLLWLGVYVCLIWLPDGLISWRNGSGNAISRVDVAFYRHTCGSWLSRFHVFSTLSVFVILSRQISCSTRWRIGWICASPSSIDVVPSDDAWQYHINFEDYRTLFESGQKNENDLRIGKNIDAAWKLGPYLYICIRVRPDGCYWISSQLGGSKWYWKCR